MIVKPGDATALAEAIEELLADEELRGALGRAARARVAQGCSWEEYGERVFGLVTKRARI
jgi:glycosyltransferase involved in cell wall biosynthesis